VITREMLQRLLGAKPATRGLACARDGRVVQLDDAKAGWLHARVQGERADAYRQWIRLERDGRGRIVGIDGQCDCPMAWNCKHVAAAVIARAGMDRAEPPTVPPAVATWLDHLQRLDARRAATPAPATKPPREVLLYLVTAEPDRPFAVRPMRVNVKKDGTLGRSARSYDPDRVLWHEPAAFVTEEDQRIMRRLRPFGVGPDRPGRPVLGADEELADVLDRVVATGRARWTDLDGPVLTQAGERAGHIAWRSAEDGGQQAVLADGAGTALDLLALTPPRYVEPASGATGPLALDLPVDLAQALVRGPVVPPAAAETVAARLGALRHARPPTPRVLDQVTRDDVAPVPSLRLFALPVRPAWGR